MPLRRRTLSIEIPITKPCSGGATSSPGNRAVHLIQRHHTGPLYKIIAYRGHSFPRLLFQHLNLRFPLFNVHPQQTEQAHIQVGNPNQRKTGNNIPLPTG